MHRQGFYFNKPSEEKIEKIISDFTSCGWEYVTLTSLGEGILMEFDWTSDSEPVYPDGYRTTEKKP